MSDDLYRLDERTIPLIDFLVERVHEADTVESADSHRGFALESSYETSQRPSVITGHARARQLAPPAGIACFWCSSHATMPSSCGLPLVNTSIIPTSTGLGSAVSAVVDDLDQPPYVGRIRPRVSARQSTYGAGALRIRTGSRREVVAAIQRPPRAAACNTGASPFGAGAVRECAVGSRPYKTIEEARAGGGERVRGRPR